MTLRRGLLATLAGLAGAAGLASVQARAEEAKDKQHRVSLQMDESRADLMNLALGNIANLAQFYASKNEAVAVEIVAYGPGLAMLRADASPVAARIEALAESVPNLVLSACANTIRAVEKTEGKPVELIPRARIVPSGIVRLVELQEQGWSYIRV